MKRKAAATQAVSRETDRASSDLAALARTYALSAGAVATLERLLQALTRDPDAPTAVRGSAAIDIHIADSLVGLEVAALKSAGAIADIGSGAGFPGLALAATLPAVRVDLIEATGRKADFIARLAAVAALDNARPIAARAEEWGAAAGRDRYDAATARALGPLPVIVEYAAPLLRHGGALVAWKGTPGQAEDDAGKRAAQVVGLELAEVRTVQPYPTSRSRHLYVYLKVNETPDRFPRRAGIAAKRPLGADAKR